MAVNTLANGHLPFRLALLKGRFQVLRYVVEDGAKGDLVEAAFWRPLLLIGTGSSDKTDKTIVAVAMADNFNNVLLSKVIKT